MKKNFLYDDYLFYIMWAIIITILIWRAKYGFPSNDETFYIATTYRFIQGDKMFLDEWNPAQMSNFLLIPILQIYLKITKTLYGIVISFRYIYIYISGLCSVIIYKLLNPVNKHGALIGSLIFLSYAPYCISAMSYNTMAIQALSVSFSIIIFNSENKICTNILVGILFASAVLCCPYLVVLYLILMILFTKSIVFKSYKNKVTSLFLGVSIGSGIMLIVFGVFVLRDVEIENIISSLHIILNLEDDYTPRNIIFIVINYFYHIIPGRSKRAISIVFAMLLTLFMALDKKRNNRINIYMMMLLISFAFNISYYVVESILYNNTLINLLMYDINIYGLIVYLIFGNKAKLKNLFLYFWCPGMIYGVLIDASSNQQFWAISSAGVVPMISSVIFIADTIDTKCNLINVIRQKALFSTLVLLLFSTLIIRIRYVFYGETIFEQKELIEDGCCARIIAANYDMIEYYKKVEDVQYIKNICNPTDIVCITENNYMYLQLMNARNNSYSSWMYRIDERAKVEHYISIFKQYYENNLDRIPSCVYIDYSAGEGFKECFYRLGNYKEYTTPNGSTYLVKLP